MASVPSSVVLVLWSMGDKPQAPFLFSLAEIARHFRFGSQEDAHEFLRYTIDAMQKACLNGYTKYGQFPVSVMEVVMTTLCTLS